MLICQTQCVHGMGYAPKKFDPMPLGLAWKMTLFEIIHAGIDESELIDLLQKLRAQRVVCGTEHGKWGVAFVAVSFGVLEA